MKRFILACFVTLALPASFVYAVPVTDIVFAIDATGSMSGEIAGVRAGFSQFVFDLDAQNVNARYAIVLFGGESELILDFTSDAATVQSRLNAIVIGANAGVHNNHNVNPEAGMEAIRMILGAAPNSVLANNNIPEDGILNFRSNSRKNIIVATDEDSDRPFDAANRFIGQNTNEPSTGGGWQAEVDATAQAIIDNDAFVNMLINRGDSPTRSQYGDYLDDVSDADFLNFDLDATLANLLADTVTDDSIQAQVLAAGLIARTFNVAGANDSDFIANFYAAKVEEIITDPGVVPEPTTLAIWSALGGIGLVASRWRRRKRAA